MFGAFSKQTAQESLDQKSDDPVKWRGKKTATQCLNFLCLSEHLADVWFNFEDSNVRLPAHKFVLSMRSEIFEAIFNGQPTEISPEVHIDDVSSDVMEQVLRYLYTEHIKIDKTNGFSVLYVAKKYVLEGLHEQCIQTLIKSVEATNTCDIYEKVQGYDVEERVSKACLEYIWRHAWKVFATEPFLKISISTLSVILENDSLTGDEISIFRAVLKWAEYQAISNDVQPTPVKLQEYIGDAIYRVRFPLMPSEVFTEEVESTGTLTANDVSVLRRYIQDKAVGMNVEVEKFNCNPRNGGIMTETIFNAYPCPDRVPGGCDEIYNILFLTTEDIRLHSIKGPLTKDFIAVKMSVHDRPGLEYSPPSQEILGKEDNWTPVNYMCSALQNEEIVFTNEPILMPNTYTYVRIELTRKPSLQQSVNITSVAPASRGRKRRGREENFLVTRATNMSLIIRETTVILSCIPPGIKQMSFR